MASITQTIDFDVFSVSYRDDDIYVVEVKEDKEFTIANMVELFSGLKRFGGKRLPVLVLCKYLASTTTEFMNYLAQEDSNPYSLADAFVLSSFNQKLMANFYMKIIRPKRPTRFFTSEEEASKWLHNLKYE
ncbi:MAG: hypothetical protein ACJ76F_08160 [Bacteroidia bacterium]